MEFFLQEMFWHIPVLKLYQNLPLWIYFKFWLEIRSMVSIWTKYAIVTSDIQEIK